MRLPPAARPSVSWSGCWWLVQRSGRRGRALASSVVVSPGSVGERRRPTAACPRCPTGCVGAICSGSSKRADGDADARCRGASKVSGVPQSAQKPRSAGSDDCEMRRLAARPARTCRAARGRAARRNCRTPSGTCGSGRSRRRSSTPSTRKRTAPHWQPPVIRCRSRSSPVSSPPWRLFGVVADGLDVVAVGVEDEGAVVVGVVHGADAGRAVVLAAGGDRGLVEGVDLRAVLGAEGDVGVRRWSCRRPRSRGTACRRAPRPATGSSPVTSLPNAMHDASCGAARTPPHRTSSPPRNPRRRGRCGRVRWYGDGPP